LPTAPGTSQASHWFVHALSQHTPSTQNPVAHSPVDEHLPPSGATHTPGVDEVLGAHTLPVEQDAVVQHTLFPAPASTQWPLVQSLSAVHSVPSAPVDLHVPSTSQV
jgi:hypothetical protein